MAMAENKEKKVLNVPNLRFPEFEGEWEKCKLGDVAMVVGGGTPDTNNHKYWNGDIQWFTPSEIGRDKYVTNSLRTISEEGLNKSSAKLLPIGTILLSSRATVGECSINKVECTTNQGFQSLIPKEYFSKEFVFYLMQTKRKELIRKSCGSTFLEISANEVRKIKIAVPTSKEQEKISKLLALLDERISTQNKIIEDLKKLKSAISKYLFERKDLFENKIKLSKVAELKNGYAFQSSKYNALGKWKILTIANVAGERYVKTNECNSIIEIPYDIQKHQKLESNDILISLTGNVGRVSLCTEGFFLLNQRVGLLQLKVSEDREYIYQALSSHKFENSMIACAQGAAQMNIGKGDVENYILPYSFNKENINSVASVLKNYDKYIINEINMLSMLHSQKQYLLRQMFI